jgi:hypothetical protein
MRLTTILAAATAVSACSPPTDGQAFSLLSLADPTAQPPLYFRHAGYVGWITPDETNSDDLDSTFVAHVPGLNGAPGSISFENQDEFPGYFLVVDGASGNRMTLVAAPSPLTPSFSANATFFALPGLSDTTACSFESVAVPGAYISSYGSTTLSTPSTRPPSSARDYRERIAAAGGRVPAAAAAPAPLTDTPCHYADCPPVFVLAPPYSPPPPDYNTSSTWVISPPNSDKPTPSTPFQLGGLYFEVLNGTGTLAVVRDAGDASTPPFSFTPPESTRQAAGSHRFGDITVRARVYGSTGPYTQATTAGAGPAPRVTPTLPGSVWASDISSHINTSAAGLSVVREYTPAPDGLGILMSLVISNTNAAAAAAGDAADATIEIGGLDVSLVMNNDWSGLSLEQTAEACSLADPYIGGDAGFVRGVRITGSGPVLLVAPSTFGCTVDPASPPAACGAKFEAWRLLAEDPAGRGVTFEGFYAYSIHSLAWQENEWSAAEPWNSPTSLVLRPGQTAVYSLRVWTVPEGNVDAIDAALSAAGVPVVRGAPGYVLTPDMQTARLVVRPPPNAVLASVEADPPATVVFGAITPAPGSGSGRRDSSSVAASSVLVVPVAVGPAAAEDGQWGRVRASLTYTLPTPPFVLVQTVHLFTVPPLRAHLDNYVNFSTTYAWFDDTTEPFGRAYSFMDYDASIGEVMLQEPRVFVVGLSDEAGAGTSLGVASHLLHHPTALAAAQLATYVNRTVIGTKLDAMGTPVSLQTPDALVRASMFWGPGMTNYTYTVSPCWDEARGETTFRAYNYPHPTAVLLSLYRAARDWEGMGPATEAVAAGSAGGLDALQPWSVYLQRAAMTVTGMATGCGDIGNSLCQYGLMAASGYAHVLDALLEEAAAGGPNATLWSDYADAIDVIQRNRTAIWVGIPFPFGSEMPWDSTGQ